MITKGRNKKFFNYCKKCGALIPASFLKRRICEKCRDELKLATILKIKQTRIRRKANGEERMYAKNLKRLTRGIR